MCRVTVQLVILYFLRLALQTPVSFMTDSVQPAPIITNHYNLLIVFRLAIRLRLLLSHFIRLSLIILLE